LVGRKGGGLAGANTAADKAAALPAGLVRLSDGADQLADGLNSGVDQIPSYSKKDRDELASAIVSPVDEQPPGLPDPDLSAGYFTALALAVAGLVLFMLIRAVPAKAMSSRLNAFALTMRAYWPAVVIAVLQTVLLVATVQIPLQLSLGKLAAFGGVVLMAS